MIKSILFSGILLYVSVFSHAQELSTKNDKTNNTEVKLEEPKTVTFPIKATKKTDPNYEKNLKKSQETEENLSQMPQVVVKDELYYESEIAKLEEQIKFAESNPDSPFVYTDKIPKMKEELDALKAEYETYKKNK